MAASHSGCATLLLELGDAFGEPPGNPLVRHLHRDDVRQLVPERRLPQELSRRLRLRRIERHDAAEAGAEGADHARQTDVRTAKSSCLRKTSIRMGPFGMNS